MSYVLAAATSVLQLDLVDEVKDLLSSIPEFFSTMNSYLPENKFVRTVIYTAGGVSLIQLAPYLLRHTEIFDYYYRHMAYIHRSCPQIKEWKEELLQELKENTVHLPKLNDDKLVILEINAGGGTHMTYYPKGAVVIATDMDESYGEKLLQNFESETGEPLLDHISLNRFIHTTPEELFNVPDNSVSAVVCIHTLCQARGLDRALSEIKRVLLPGGRFYFIEHIQVPKLFSMQWFQQIRFLVTFAMVSCHVGRPTQKAIEKAGFSETKCEKFDADFSNVFNKPIHALSPHIYGFCVK